MRRAKATPKKKRSDAALLKAFVDAVPDLMLFCEFDADFTEAVIVAVNRTTEAILGMSAQELVGQRPRDLLAQDAQPSLELRRALFAEARKRGVVEFPDPPLLRGRRMRMRIIVPDPAGPYVLFQGELSS
jgi:PAS domain-containing protein